MPYDATLAVRPTATSAGHPHPRTAPLAVAASHQDLAAVAAETAGDHHTAQRSRAAALTDLGHAFGPQHPATVAARHGQWLEPAIHPHPR